MTNLDPRTVAALPQFPRPPARHTPPPEPTSTHIVHDPDPATAAELRHTRPAPDPWTLDDTTDSYNPGTFYIKTVLSKRNGGSPKNVQVPMDPQLHMVVSAIIQQRVVPAYNTIQDLIRDAILHRVHQLTHGTDDLPVYITDPYVTQLAQLARDSAREEMLAALTTQELERVQRFHALYDDISATGNRAHMAELGDRIRDAIYTVNGHTSRERLRELAVAIDVRLAQMNRGGA